MSPKREAVWQGRLAAGLDPRAQRLNDSLPVDGRLIGEELALSRAYAATLAECGVMSEAERDALVAASDALEADLGAGRAKLSGEDVHSAVEAALAERCGDAARRLHTGRSRNDQVATLFRMHVMKLCDTAVEGVRELERALVTQARESGGLLCASYTHLQPAQPIRLAHWWLAHVEALARDEERLAEAREAADRLPLGSGAVAGTPLKYDRALLATRLGFSRVAMNSLDAVGDRDFAVQYLNAAALLGVHLSRLAEDLVLYCSPGFGWFAAPDGFSTGSSLLPQKRNPDLFELARGKSARLLANAQRLSVLLKGLPSSYQKDLQEDKEAVFDTADTLEPLLLALPPAIDALVPQRERIAASLTTDLLAVELADALVAEGVPFRDAHRAVGALWAAAEQAVCEPAALPLESVSRSRRTSPTRSSGSSRSKPPWRAALTRPAPAPPRTSWPSPRRAWAWGPAMTPMCRQRRTRSVATPPSSGHACAGPAKTAAHGHAARRHFRQPAARSADGLWLRRARVADVPGIAGVVAPYVVEGVLLPRPVSELYQCVREFHVVERAAPTVRRAASWPAPRCACCGATWARCARSPCAPTRTAGAWVLRSWKRW